MKNHLQNRTIHVNMKMSFEKQFYIISKFVFIYHYYSNNTTHSNGKSEQGFDRRVFLCRYL